MKLFVKNIILFVNILLFLFNLILLFVFSIEFINRSVLFLKNSDSFNIKLLNKTYSEISFYLNNKFNINNLTKLENKTNEKKLIKVFQTGGWNKNWDKNWLLNKLNDEFIIEFNETDPDYLIYNVFDKYNVDLNTRFKNSVKIAFYTENIMVDINYADYIIGNYHINYLDRYFEYSVPFLYRDKGSIDKIREKALNGIIRNNFCAAVISNCGSFYGFRLNFIEKLSKYKKVDMGGNCKNNINKKITDKIQFLSNYKFSIAMENSEGDGYLSEKIVDSFLAGTIPIYYGGYMLDEIINQKTYILIKGVKDMDEKIEYIKKIDNDINLYKSIMKEKPILDDNFVDKIDKNEIKSFLKNIFRQDKKKAFRRDDNYYDFNCKFE